MEENVLVQKRPEWDAYRQALADLTQNFQNVEDVIWPDPPN